NTNGLKAVADVIYNHRDGGAAENNTAVEGWIENFTYPGNNAYPSDRFRNTLPIGGSTGRGTGDDYFKVASKSGHSDFYNRGYKFYIWTNQVGWQGSSDQNETEPNGGGDCSQGNNSVSLGVNMFASVHDPSVTGCGTDEFHLTLNSSDYNSAGDTIYIVLSNTGSYSDHYIYGLWYDNGTSGSDIQSAVEYQTYTDFTNLPSGSGSMNWQNFKPNGNPTNLQGDWDWMWFYYDYDQFVADTKSKLFAWSEWLWSNVGIRGLRMDAVKHFTYEFVGDLLDDLHSKGMDPGLVVGEFYDSNTALLKGWIDNVYTYMDAATQSAIQPRVFDFALRSALKTASEFGGDARDIFTASMVDAAGANGFNVVTFVNNHDFRDSGQPIDKDPILAYAYILTNNQVGLPTVYYPDYYPVSGFSYGNLKSKIDSLIDIHKNYIFGATSRDYLSRYSTPYSPSFTSGLASTTAIYQIMNTSTGRDVIVALNYAGDPLNVEIGINMSSVANGDTFSDVVGNATTTYSTVSNGRITLQIPVRSYSVWVKDAVPVPVELVSFTANVSGNKVKLKWNTATEVNNYGFDVERTSPLPPPYQGGGNDVGGGWENIGFVEGHGNSNSPKEYEFVDEHIIGGSKFQYRLKQIDNDGKYEYSNIVEVEIAPGKFELFQNYPNPFNPSTTIKFSIPFVETGHAPSVQLKVYDVLGNEVAILLNEEKSAGTYQVNFDASNLASGVYFYRLQAGGFIQTKRMLVMK
ncbi:MAG TPA: T9SS type A sorting domain-containing protein, partial [Ignavibacteriales bacterium]|nr:T9SS type A sorting domain-containing protein [Ignavibacteriales bacterium]